MARSKSFKIRWKQINFNCQQRKRSLKGRKNKCRIEEYESKLLVAQTNSRQINLERQLKKAVVVKLIGIFLSFECPTAAPLDWLGRYLRQLLFYELRTLSRVAFFEFSESEQMPVLPKDVVDRPVLCEHLLVVTAALAGVPLGNFLAHQDVDFEDSFLLPRQLKYFSVPMEEAQIFCLLSLAPMILLRFMAYWALTFLFSLMRFLFSPIFLFILLLCY